jgi:transposase
MNIRYRVKLSSEERALLCALVQGGKGPARKVKRAQILLAAARGSSDEGIAAHVSVGTATVYRTKRRFVEEGLEQALNEASRPGAERKLAAKEEALLVATVCSKPPSGRARWTLSLLADEMVRLTEHRSLSGETVRRRLAEKELKPWQEKMWCIPKVDAEFVARPTRSRKARSRLSHLGRSAEPTRCRMNQSDPLCRGTSALRGTRQ